jgi:hypothetical protein
VLKGQNSLASLSNAWGIQDLAADLNESQTCIAHLSHPWHTVTEWSWLNSGMNPNSQSDSERSRKWKALLLVLVLAVFGVVQVVHVHNGSANEDGPSSPATHCSICVAAHAVPLAPAISPAPVLTFTTHLVFVSDPELGSHLVVSSAFIRPPPQAL